MVSSVISHTCGHIVYGLRDPRTAAIRYIGKSATGLSRPRSHFEPKRIATDSNLHKARWLRSLAADGLRPEIVILEACRNDATLLVIERRWIAHGRALGWPLTNLTDGGEGAAGYKASPEARAKMSAARKGKPKSEECKAKIRAAKLGKPRPDVAERNRRAPTWLGKKHSDETRAKIAASLVGNNRGSARSGWDPSPETRARMAEGQRRRWAASRYRPALRINLL